ncbi:MAG: ACT domain-containing protein [Thermoleophilia bacterium]
MSMAVSQLSVFVENKTGRVAEVMRFVADKGLKVIGFTIADTTDYGIVRLVVDRSPEARDALRDHGFTVIASDVLCVETGERGSALAALVEVLSDHMVNVEYMYLTTREAAVVKVEEGEKAEKLLSESGFRVLSQKDLADSGS